MANTKRYCSSIFIAFMAAFVPYLSNANQFNVGGSAGWVVNPPEPYNQWAGRMRFQVNDTLFFKHNKGSNSVLEVNKDDYFQCNVNNPILRLDDGNSVFKFNRSGPFFFISGNKTFCDEGQKLIVVVMAIRYRAPPQTPPTASQPPPPLAPSPPPSSSSSPSPSPASTGVPASVPIPSPSSSSPSPASIGVPSPASVPIPSPSSSSSSPSPASIGVPSPSSALVPASGPSISPTTPSPVATAPSNAPRPGVPSPSPGPVPGSGPSISPTSASPVATAPSNAPTPGSSPVSRPPPSSPGEAPPPPSSSESPPGTPTPPSSTNPANSTSPSNAATRPAFTPSVVSILAVSTVFSVTFGAPIFL